MEQYQVKWSFQPYISYRQGETVRHVSLDALATFSTAGTDDIEMFSEQIWNEILPSMVL